MSAQRLFISFSDKEERWCRELVKHLRSMPSPRARVIRWSHFPSQPGDEWRADLERFCASADVAFLLVSPSFLASEHHRHNEVPVLLDAQRRGLRVVPILIQPVSIAGTPVEAMQFANSPMEPLISLDTLQRERFWRVLIGQLDAEHSSKPQPLVKDSRHRRKITLPESRETTFLDTKWDVVMLAATETDTAERNAALESICRSYWNPIHAFLRKQGHSPEDASDITQGFFQHLLARDVFARLNPHKGRFRSFLLSYLHGYVTGDRHKHSGERRGGSAEFVLRDATQIDSSASSGLEDTQSSTSEFDRAWALTVVGEASRRLQQEFENSGRSQLYEALWPIVTEEAPYGRIAQKLQMSEGAARMALHRFRHRFQELLRQTVGETVSHPADLEDELHYVLTVLASGSQTPIGQESPSPRQTPIEDRGPQSFPTDQEHTIPLCNARKPADFVRFSAFLPTRVRPAAAFLIEVWAYLESQRAEVVARASQQRPAEQLAGLGDVMEGGTAGPVKVPREAPITFHLVMPEFNATPNQETIWWAGSPANVAFAVRAPDRATSSTHLGRVEISRCGMPIATVHFEVILTEQNDPTPKESVGEHVRTIFASYATEDRPEVLLWARGAQEAGVEVFVDVLTLRAGQDWEKKLWEQVPSRDRFCLFWSGPASRSRWVEKEWRCALEKRGINYIRPVPFADPRDVPPPPELSASQHFNDLLRIVYEYERQRR